MRAEGRVLQANVWIEKSLILVAYGLVLALVVCAVVLWRDEISEVVTSDAGARNAAQPTLQPVTRPSAEPAHLDLDVDADPRVVVPDTSSDQQAKVELLLHQLQAGEHGISVHNASGQGLSGYLGLRDADQITHVNGQAVRQVDDIQALLHDYHPKQKLHFQGRRDGQAMSWTYQAQADD